MSLDRVLPPARAGRAGPRRRGATAALVLLAALLLIPAVSAGAAEEAAQGGSEEASEAAETHAYGELLWEAGNLLLLLGVLVYLARRPVQNYMGERRERIRDEIADAERVLREAEARLAEWNEKAAALDEEVAEIRRLTRERAEAERERILEEAHRTAERIRRDAGAAVDRELERAREALRREAADLAVQSARRLLEQQVSAEDRERLVAEFVARVERGTAADAEAG